MSARILAATSAIAVMTAGAVQAQICTVTPWNTTNQAPSAETRMTVSAGHACSVSSARNDVVVTVTRQPRNGTVTINGGIAIYRPRPGFTGRDSFVTRRELMQAGPSAVTIRTLTVDVTVLAVGAPGLPATQGQSGPNTGSRPVSPPVAALPRPPVPPALGPCVPSANFGGTGSTTQTVPMRVRAGTPCSVRIQGSGISVRIDAPP